MLLHHTRKDPISGGFAPHSCGSDAKESVCFTNEPLSGVGPWVYVVDLPDAHVAPHERTVRYRSEGVRFYEGPACPDPAAEWARMQDGATPDEAFRAASEPT